MIRLSFCESVEHRKSPTYREKDIPIHFEAYFTLLPEKPAERPRRTKIKAKLTPKFTLSCRAIQFDSIRLDRNSCNIEPWATSHHREAAAAAGILRRAAHRQHRPSLPFVCRSSPPDRSSCPAPSSTSAASRRGCTPPRRGIPARSAASSETASSPPASGAPTPGCDRPTRSVPSASSTTRR